MSIRWVISIGFLWLGCTLISGIMEQTYLGSSESGLLMLLISPDIPSYSNFIEGTVAYITLGRDWILAFWEILWFDYAMFQGGWIALRLFFCCISLGMIFGFIQFMRGSK